MIASCRLCGQLVTGRNITSLKFAGARPAPEDERTEGELQEFDFLGMAFTQHIVLHHKKEATELAAVANLTSKVYAMRQAQYSDEAKFETLRVVWAETIRLAIFGNCLACARHAADLPGEKTGAPSPSSSSPSSSPPSGS
jgi:hypothetical protein